MRIFTYLIGAGASANVLPTVKDLGESLKSFFDFIDSTTKLNETESLLDLNSSIKKDLKWLINQEKKHASIDTFARKLFLTEEEGKLRTLKNLIDSFFTTLQILHDTDKRYDAFLATLLSKSNEGKVFLPPNINILSWNYDFQFELSLLNFIKATEIKDLEDAFKIVPNSKNVFSILEEFCLVKLNGTSGGLIKDQKFIRKEFLSLIYKDIGEIEADEQFEKKIDIYKKLIENYNSTMKNEDLISSIMFAWEKIELTRSIKEYTKKKIGGTSILTVIGYSFPTFNRETDKQLLYNMNQLDKIIIQAPKEDIDSVEFRIRSLLDPAMQDLKIEHVTATNEFFIPFEFN